MKKFVLVFFTLLIFSLGSCVFAQKYSAYTSYAWDTWKSNEWAYLYKNGWVYAVKAEYSWGNLKPVGNARDFYFRFKYSDLGLRELTRKEWKELNKGEVWKTAFCDFEYYITDKYPTIKSSLTAYSWPCAKAYNDPRKPAVLKRERVIVKVHYTDDDEVRDLNFWFGDSSDCSFGITVHWDYSKDNMTYSY
jgi:hypothetical protein